MKKYRLIFYLSGILGLFLINISFAQARSIGEILTKGLLIDGGIKEIADIFVLLGDILTIVFTGAAIVAVIYLIIGGYHYVTAYGNPETAQKGKQTILWSIIGLVIALAAYAIVQFVWSRISRGEPPGPTTFHSSSENWKNKI